MKTISEIIHHCDLLGIEKVVLDYCGDIQEFESPFDIPSEICDDEATSTFRKGVLKIVVR